MSVSGKTLYRKERAPIGGLREFLTVLFKHKYTILVVFSLSVLIGLVVSFLLPPTYEARSTVLIKVGREYISSPEVGNTRALLSLEQQEVLNSEIQILSSRELIEKVVTLLKVETLYPKLAKKPTSKISPRESSILQVEKHLAISGVKKSNVIEVSFQHEDPKVAAKVVNLLIELFREKHLKVFSDPQSSFLEKQLRIYQAKLGESEQTMESFKQSNQVFSLDEQRSLLLRQRTDLDSTLKNTDHRIDELREKLLFLKNQKITSGAKSRTMYTNTEKDKILVDAKARLLTLQLTEQDLLKRYREDSRRVEDVRNEIQTVKNFLKEQEEYISGTVETGGRIYQEVELEIIKTEADLKSQVAKAAGLRQQLRQLDGQIRTLDLNDRKFQTLKREMASNEKYFRTYEDRVEEARISEDMNRSKLANISVIQPATVPAKPVRPKKLLNMLLSLFIGAFSGLGLALVSEHLSQGLTTPDSVERRLGLRVLTTISLKEA
jgi:uncharacterized protein involved in exopolysaccharide biosynthesis